MSEDASLSDFLEDEVEAAAGDGDDTAESDDVGDDEDAAGDDAEREPECEDHPERAAGEAPDSVDSEPADLEAGDPDGLESADPGGIDPVRPTYAWGNDVACADCGDRVDRAWRDGDEYVCGSCKDW